MLERERKNSPLFSFAGWRKRLDKLRKKKTDIVFQELFIYTVLERKKITSFQFCRREKEREKK